MKYMFDFRLYRLIHISYLDFRVKGDFIVVVVVYDKKVV